MEFNYAYASDSTVESGPGETRMAFAPDTYRQPTFFRGELEMPLAFREAISALHDVVISDHRWHPKDRSAYREWLRQQEEVDWMQVAARQARVAERLAHLREERHALRQRASERMRPFDEARGRYFQFLFERFYDAWLVLDPVITVHPDEVFFECFSRDESSYGRLSAGFEVFRNVGEFACGTTNVDYSSALYGEFQKIRTYKKTEFEIDPSGFEVQTRGDAAHKEVKIDLPDSWVRGFLQVSSAMALPATVVRLHAMDVHNMCLILRRKRETFGPRSIRFRLRPGEPVSLVFDPWQLELRCPRSIYEGDVEQEIRVWGRRRIHILERLIPLAREFKVYLLGSGMPSFYVADLGAMTFTLGLSGWTANDWSSASHFDLLAPRADVDEPTGQRVFEGLKENWSETPDSLARRLGLDRAVVLGALGAYTQAGRAIWDLNKQVYRVRELSREVLPMERLRFSSPREAAASRFLEQRSVRLQPAAAQQDSLQLTGTVRDGKRTDTPSLVLDADQRIVEAACTCNWHQQYRLRKGPCEHILALRMQFDREQRP